MLRLILISLVLQSTYANTGSKCMSYACSANVRFSNSRHLRLFDITLESQAECSSQLEQSDCGTGEDKCLLLGWASSSPRLVTNECDKTYCNRIVNSDYTQGNFQYSSYVYVPNQATTLPGGADGPACVTACTTDNEPFPSSPEDQGWAGLPWCYTNSAQTTWAYCFPSNAPPCGYELGYVPSSGEFTRCSLNCPSGYNGYQVATCNKKNNPLVWPTSPTSDNLCTPILCNAYSLPSQFVPSTSNPCSSTNEILSVTILL